MARDEGLDKRERVLWRSLFVRIQKTGRKLSSDHFSFFVLARPKDEDGPARLGVTVSSRVGNAVVRNRVKRLIREAFRKSKSTFPPGTDWVVVARPQAAQVELPVVLAEMTKVCQKHGKERGAR